MTSEEMRWKIRYLGSSEVFERDIWEGRFLVSWNGQEREVKVELSVELKSNIENKWPEIDSDPDSLIHRLGKKAIQKQVSQRGEVDKVIYLYKNRYPGYPGRPDV